MKRKANSGSALIFVLVFMVLGIMIGTSAMALSSYDFQLTHATLTYEASYYEAESAAQMAAQIFLDEFEDFSADMSYSTTLDLEIKKEDVKRGGAFNCFFLGEEPQVPRFDFVAFTEFTDDDYRDLEWFPSKVDTDYEDYSDDAFELKPIAKDPYDPAHLADVADKYKQARDAIEAKLAELGNNVKDRLQFESSVTVDSVEVSLPDTLIGTFPYGLDWNVYVYDVKEYIFDPNTIEYRYVVRYTMVDGCPLYLDTKVKGRTVRIYIDMSAREVQIQQEVDAFGPVFDGDGNPKWVPRLDAEGNYIATEPQSDYLVEEADGTITIREGIRTVSVLDRAHMKYDGIRIIPE